MQDLLLHGSFVLVIAWLLLGGLGVPLPEDLAVISAGVLVHRGVVPWALAVPGVLGAVLFGDTMLFLIARRLGPAALERPRFAKLLPETRRDRLAILYERYGGRLVFLARHIAGLRGTVFAFAGINRMALPRFLLWDLAGASLSVPLMLVLGYLGSAHVDRVRAGVAHVEHWILLGAAVAGVAYLAFSHRRRILGRCG